MLRSEATKFGKFAHYLSSLLSLGSGLSMPRSPRRGPRLPTAAALRNPADPFQSERIQAAADKRRRKAQKLIRNLAEATLNNRAHATRSLVGGVQAYDGRLNPFHVNK